MPKSTKRQQTEDQRWNTRYKQLVQFNEEHGHIKVPWKHPLGIWVDRQRTKYKKGKLSSEQIESMNGIGFEWTPYLGWDVRFEQLKGYKKDHGNCEVPWRYKANPQLGKWVNKQRHLCRKGKLPKERIESLNKIGFKWILGKGRRTDIVVVSDVEEEDPLPTDDEDNEIDNDKTGEKKKTIKAKTGQKIKPARCTKYQLRSSKSKDDKNEEEPEKNSTLDNDVGADDGGDFGGVGDSLDFNDDDGGDIPRSNDVNNESEALSKEIKQLKEDMKVLTKKYDERGRTIEQQKRKDELLEDILEKQKKNLIERERLVLRQFGDAKAEVCSRILELEKELEAARAKTPKTRSQKRKCSASPESINSPRKKASVLESIAGPDTVEVRV